ncbi:MAG: amino acid adenylation domain-containing protein [Candidatus Aminicenantes bacterium]|nr:MAG: amino acid adenylation domain-containing protein [Candidatus Aminicenantes bacterium]
MKKYDNILLSTRKYKLQRDFWINYLQDLEVEPILQTQTGSHDREHPGKGFPTEPHRIDFVLQPAISEQLIKLSKNSDETLYIVMLSAFISFLYRYTGKNDISLSTPVFPVSGKKNLFNDLLVFRKVINGNKTFKDILLEVRKTFMEVIENQDYPFEKIVEELEFLTDRTYDMLFDLIFASGDIHKIPGIKDNGNNLLVSFHKNENHIKISCETNGGYTRGEIERMAKYFNRILASLVTDLSVNISETELLDQEEKKRFLYDFNDTAASFPRHKTIHELFAEQVEKTPQCTALMHEDHHITYRVLNEKSRQLAGRLVNRGVKGDQIVGILVRYSPELIIGILGILKAGAAYLPLDSSSIARSRFMLKDSGAKLVVITKGLSDGIFREIGEIDVVYPGQSCPNREYAADTCGPDNLAYIIYTSGTTGKPKGVMIQQKGLVNYIYWAAKNYVKNEPLYFPLHTSIAFDLTVTSIFTPLITGQAIVIYGGDTGEFSVEIDKVIEENKVGVVKLTPSHLKLIRNKPINRSLSAVKRFIVGGEELNTQLAGDIVKCFPGNIEIYNEYGPTEATVGCMIYQFDENRDKERKSVPIGVPAANMQIYIFDRQMRTVPEGIAGEIYISGHGLARGYLNRPELTAEKFIFYKPYRSYRSYTSYISKRIFKTGDLARMLPDGNLEFLGRIDQQVKIRGYRIEPVEIERRLLSHDEIKEVVVTAREDQSEEKYLCAYIVPRSAKATASLSVSQLRKFSSLELPAYMIPSYFMILDKIPLTLNGKVDGKALPNPDTSGTTDGYVAPRDVLEKTLEELWYEVLFRGETQKIEKNAIGIDANFFELGGHSLNATILVSKIHKVLNVKVSLTQMFKAPTIRGLSEYIKDTSEDKYNDIEIVPQKDYYALSSAQKRLYLLHLMDEEGTGYNIPSVVKLKGVCDKVRLEDTFKWLIKRHDSLRTSLLMVEEEPVQRIHETVGFGLEYDEAMMGDEREQSKKQLERITANFFKPFDLSRAPLLRVGLIKVDDRVPVHLLMVDMHHIISDGVSMEIFIREFMALYGGEELPPLRLQYKDYAQWQNREQESDSIKKQEAYWVKLFEGEIPVLTLPTDFPRPVVQSFAGDRLNFELGEEATRALRALALEEGVTLYMVLVALFNLFLSKIASQEDIVIGTPIAGRRHADLIDIIGMFVNTLALRNDVPGHQPFREYLGQVKDNTLEAFENQEYQYENLVEKVAVVRDTSRNPLFDVMFILQNVDSPKIEIRGLTLEPHLYNNYTSKFDLTLEAIEDDNALLFTFEYATRLFKKETIHRFIDYFKKITLSVKENPGQKISRIEIISPEEKKRILNDFNNTKVEYPKHKTIHRLFAEQVERTPGHIALLGVGTRFIASDLRKQAMHVTYRELNERTNQLGRVLIQRGVKPDTIVGIMMERSLEMIIGILGILKAGGAYLPIDPDYPDERSQYMLADSGAKILISDRDDVKTGHCSVFVLDLVHVIHYETVIQKKGAGSEQCSVPTLLPATSLAYVIYTSGSTGKPKGVLVEHCSVVNILCDLQRKYPISQIDNYLFKTSVLFDVSVTELFGWFMGGGWLTLLEPLREKDPWAIMDVVERDSVTHINFVPSMFNTFVQILNPRNIHRLFCLKYIFLAGEALLPELVEKFRRFGSPILLENIYGPTEGTIYSSNYSLSQWQGTGNISIGKPMQNVTLYILDNYNRLQPVGIVGELCIGGLGLARGYLNRPELTAEKFDHDLWDYQDGNHRSYRFYMSYISKRLYKTGDLARLWADGNIEFLGRIDHQVKIRGFRIEIAEIESSLSNHKAVRYIAVVANEDQNGDKDLCAYIVLNEEVDVSELKIYLSEKLPSYMIPSYFVILDKMPLTSTGKIDRRVLPGPVPEVRLGERAAPLEETEQKVANLWAEVLGIPKDKVDIHTNFFESGGHSLKAVVLISKIHKELYAKLPLITIFKAPTIYGLARYIKSVKIDKYAFIEAVEKKEYYVLSSTQRRLYFLWQMEKGTVSYNLPLVTIVNGKLARYRFEEVVRRLIERHESLRTGFLLRGKESVQRIHRKVDLSISDYEAADEDDEQVKAILAGFIRPFDLSRAPLFRVGLIKINPQKHLLLFDMHHIISDGVSMALLVSEFVHLYEEKTLPVLRIQYKDFSQWENALLKWDRMKKQEVYWLNRFKDDIPMLAIPTDYPRQAMQKSEGDRVQWEIDSQLTIKIKTITRESDATLFIFLLAVYIILLSKYAEQEDIVVGIPVAGRNHADLQDIVGMFVNTLAIRSHPNSDKTFTVFLEEIKENALNAYENQDYPFDTLVEKLEIARQPGRNPLFDTLFVSEDLGTPELRVKDLEFIPYEFENAISHMDLVLYVNEPREQIGLILEYATALYKRSTVEEMLQDYIEILEQVAAHRNIRLEDIQISHNFLEPQSNILKENQEDFEF